MALGIATGARGSLALLAAWTPNISKGAEGSEQIFLARLRRGFEEHLPGFGRLAQNVVQQVLPDLVRRWFYDVRFGINATDWWPVLDRFPPPMQRQVSAFAKALADCFIGQMKQSRAHLARILTRYTHLLLVVKEGLRSQGPAGDWPPPHRGELVAQVARRYGLTRCRSGKGFPEPSSSERPCWTKPMRR
ncbi:hypothetical protein [Myxococcus stipitatus]|uniref:hypothetical protein n=1 Tax=Myxococcus stipitatus TaxID=83455 RepID=UPI001185F2F8|nr:hypothetical protein [Myxococcus stipitatus]